MSKTDSTAENLVEGKTIGVTGAAGHLGRLAIGALRDRGVPAGDIVAVVRNPGKASDLADAGVQVRTADYDDPDALRKALAGVDRLLFVSASVVGERARQHDNVIAAAKEAGVGFIAYTSLLRAGESRMILAEEHRHTERALADGGIPHALLRNGWYWENFAGAVSAAAGTGSLVGTSGDGRIAGAARRDYAEAAAAVLTTGGHAGKVYELAGAEHPTQAGLARIVAEAAGRDVDYEDVSEAAFTDVLESAGMPRAAAAVIADSYARAASGELDAERTDLRELIGREATPAAEALAATLRA